MSALAVVLVVLGVVVLLFFVGGVLGARNRDRQVAPNYERHLAEADQALEAARAADRGWDRSGMERVAHEALAEAHPGVTFERLDLVLVDDRPGVSEDRAHFEATGDGRRVRVVLTRGAAGWAGRVADRPPGG